MKTYTTNFHYTQLSIDVLLVSGMILTFLETEAGKPYYSTLKGIRQGKGRKWIRLPLLSNCALSATLPVHTGTQQQT